MRVGRARAIHAVVAALAMAVGGCAQDGAFAPASEAARSIDALWRFMLVTSTAVFALVVVLLLIGVVRRGDHEAREHERGDRLFIVGGGILLPAVVLLGVLAFNIDTVVGRSVGDGTVDIEVIGNRWWWEVRYPEQGIISANELHIPTGEPVRIHLMSNDVLHSFWVPELAGKRDAVPGRETTLSFTADEPGVYPGRCAEFCGIQHANMDFFVVAHDPGDFADWADRAAEPVPEPRTAAQRRGREVFMDVGCAACHAIRGTPADGQLGPDLTHFASRRTIGAGAADNTRGHLGGWVTNSQTIKPGNLMPPQQVPADELPDLLDYLESLE